MSLDINELLHALDRLHTTGTDVHAWTDTLNHAIRQVEHAVNTLSLGIEVRVELPPTRAGAPIWLGYGRVGDKGWGFLVWEDETLWSWHGAPRWLRIRTVQAFPNLLARMRQVADELIVELQKTTALAKEYAEAVKRGLGTGSQ